MASAWNQSQRWKLLTTRIRPSSISTQLRIHVNNNYILQYSPLRSVATNTIHQRSSISSTASEIDASSLTYNRDNGVIYQTTTNKTGGGTGELKPLFQTIIGIEIHAQLSVPTKLFSSTPTKHHPLSSQSNNNNNNNNNQPSLSQPNTSVHPFDIAYPGYLPRLSKSSVQAAILSAAALECNIHPKSRFERKHYHYADLPLGYQMTQQRWPLASNGTLTCRRWFPPEAKMKKNTKKKKKKKRSRRNQTNVEENENDDHDDDSIQEQISLSKFFSVGIDRIQIEQDTGKTTTISNNNNNHNNNDGNSTINTNKQHVQTSLIDFNRAGSTLIEIVFLPQIKSAHEAVSVVSTLQSLLKHIDTCDGKMEEGSLRCDLNVSISPYTSNDNDNNDQDITDPDLENPFQHYLPPNTGHRVEVKNLNSLKQVVQSTEYEVLRQASCRLNGQVVSRETKTFDTKRNQTVKIRDKSAAVDYRFMPEPDLPPLYLDHILDGQSLDSFLKKKLPELPEPVITRLIGKGVSEDLAIIVTSDRHAISFFEETVQTCLQSLDTTITTTMDPAKVYSMVANFQCNDLLALVKDSATQKDSSPSSSSSSKQPQQSSNEEETTTVNTLNHPITLDHARITPQQFGILCSAILNETISSTQGKKILYIMFHNKHDQLDSDTNVVNPMDIAKENNWILIKDPIQLKEICRNVVLDESNQGQLEQYKQGGKHIRKIYKFFIGKVMKETNGNAHPTVMNDMLTKVLNEVAPDVDHD